MSGHILVMHPDTWKLLVSEFEPFMPLDDATNFSLPISAPECDTMGSDDLLMSAEGKMNEELTIEQLKERGYYIQDLNTEDLRVRGQNLVLWKKAGEIAGEMGRSWTEDSLWDLARSLEANTPAATWDYSATAEFVVDVADSWGEAGIAGIRVRLSGANTGVFVITDDVKNSKEFCGTRDRAIEVLALMLKGATLIPNRAVRPASSEASIEPVTAISPLTIKQSIPTHRQKMIDETVGYLNKYLTGMAQQGKGIEKPITIYVSYDDRSDLAGAWGSVHEEVVDRFKEAGWVIARIEDVRLHYGSVIAYEFRFPDDLIYKDAE